MTLRDTNLDKLDNGDFDVLIVGGGTAGWMTAALLSKETDMEICLIESANQKPIGVGESTIQHINKYLARLGIKDEDWMKSCNATYKAAIGFKNFRQRHKNNLQQYVECYWPS